MKEQNPMKVGLFLSFMLVLGMTQLSAQNVVPSRDAQRGPGTPRAPVKSPEVSTDGKVTFRLRAPGAKEVLVRGISQTPLAMQKDGDGVWSMTTDALKPDLYAYSFLVDGLSIVDPSNTKFRPAYRTMNQSAVLVPGANAWTPRANVRRGAVARHVFHSAVAANGIGRAAALRGVGLANARA